LLDCPAHALSQKAHSIQKVDQSRATTLRSAHREAEFLLGLSDEALARRGPTRVRVVRPAFRRLLAK
jgi:hypothetical protein